MCTWEVKLSKESHSLKTRNLSREKCIQGKVYGSHFQRKQMLISGK